MNVQIFKIKKSPNSSKFKNTLIKIRMMIFVIKFYSLFFTTSYCPLDTMFVLRCFSDFDELSTIYLLFIRTGDDKYEGFDFNGVIYIQRPPSKLNKHNNKNITLDYSNKIEVGFIFDYQSLGSYFLLTLQKINGFHQVVLYVSKYIHN